MNRMKIGVAAVGVLAFLPAALPLSAQAQEKSGVAAAVNPNAVSTPPGQTSRTLLIGAEVIFRERIATQADGQVQLIFLDESSLTVGPGSDVTIDEFVYDPKAKTGKMSVKIAGGLVRFVGGRISKNGDVTINTPVSVIGIRGGMGYVEATPTSATATNLFGTLSVKGAAGGEQIVSRPGFAVTTDQGQIPASPVKVDPAQLVRLSKSLEAPPQAAARNASGAIEGKMDRSQVSEKNSDQAPASISPDATAQRAESAKNPTSSDFGLVRQAVQQSVTSTIQNSVIENTGFFSGEFTQAFNRAVAFFSNGRIDRVSNIARFTLNNGAAFSLQLPSRGESLFSRSGSTTTSAYQAPDGRYFFYNISSPVINGVGQTTFTGGQAVKPSGYQITSSVLRTFDFVADTGGTFKFLGNAVAPYSNKVETPMIWRTAPSGSLGDDTTARTVTLYAALGIDGEGAAQRSGVVVSTGKILLNPDGLPAATGGVRGTFNDGGVNPVVQRFAGSITSVQDSAGNSFFGRAQPDYYTINQDDRNSVTGALLADTAAFRRTPPGQTLNVTSSVQYIQALATSPTPSSAVSADTPRTSRTMNGFIGGQVGMAQQPATGTLQLSTQGLDPTNVSITTDATTNRLVAQFKVDTLPTAPGGAALNFNGNTPGRAVFGEFVRFEFNFGSITGPHRSRSAFVDDKVYAAIEQALTNSATTGSFYANGGVNNPNPTLKPVGGPSLDPTAGTNNADDIYLVSSGAVPIANLMPPGVTACECSFMSWGWWGGSAGFDDPANISRTARINLANYVVGVLPRLDQIPTTGSAVYSGHVIGTVRDGTVANSSQYIAAGGFQKNWDFASRSGTLAIRSFDGANYSATSTPVANPGQFAYSGSGGKGALSVNGAFFSSPTDPVKGVGGQFLINNSSSSYRASGIIVGQR